jgi:hypothetical protein
LTAQLGNARLLTMVGDGHNASFVGNTACIDNAVEAYLEDGVLPPEGMRCRQEVPSPRRSSRRAAAPTPSLAPCACVSTSCPRWG